MDACSITIAEADGLPASPLWHAVRADERLNRRPLRIVLAVSDSTALEERLQHDGVAFTATWVTDPEDFARALEGVKPDVVLTDLRLLSPAGLRAMRTATDRASEVPFILVSDVSDEELALIARESGASDHVSRDSLHRLAPAVLAAVERRRTSSLLERNESLFRLISENVSDCIELLDLQRRRLYITPSARALTGRETDDDVWSDILQEDRPAVDRAHAMVLRTGQDRTVEFRMQVDGSVRYLESRCRLVRSADDRPWALLVVTRDITERRHEEENRQEAERMERLRRDLEVAREVQRNLLPAPVAGGRLRVFQHLEAAYHVGGDFFDLHPFQGEENFLICAIGDVAGKGIAASLLMVELLAVFRELVRRTRSPGPILRRMNKRLEEHMAAGGQRYATVAVLTLDLQRRTLSCASAGHEPPIVWRPTQGAKLLKTSGVVLGFSTEVEYSESLLTLEPKSKIVLYTDGIVEARSPSGGFYGTERLLSLIDRYGHRSPSFIGRRILKDVAHYVAGHPASDDVALVVVEVP